MNSYVVRTRLTVVGLDIGEGPPVARGAYCPRKPGISTAESLHEWDERMLLRAA
jgi:hypothetical protein